MGMSIFCCCNMDNINIPYFFDLNFQEDLFFFQSSWNKRTIYMAVASLEV